MGRTRVFKDAIYEQFSRIGKAVSTPKRIELLELLCQGPRTVEVLAAEAGVSIANASQHLQVLRNTHLVVGEKHGLHVEYRLADDAVGGFLLALRHLAEARLAEVDHVTRSFFEAHSAVEAVDHDALLGRVKRGEVTVLDVRPREEFRAGHLPRALSMPLEELKTRLKELPKGKDVVAYCRGPYCVMAADAVTLLRKKGIKAYRMDFGVVDFRALGWPIDAEPSRGVA